MGFDPSNILYPSAVGGGGGTPNPNVTTPMSLASNSNSNTAHSNAHGLGNDWIADATGWSLPSMDYGTKAPVPQSLLSFSGESMTSADDLVFSASSASNSGSGSGGGGGGGSGSGVSNNGSLASGNGNGNGRNSVGGVPGLKGGDGQGQGHGEVYRGITIPIDDMDDFEFAELDS